ncbi:MAG: signal recognition particle receptor subunit alpha [Candidatus Woesearchaeota archaeon]
MLGKLGDSLKGVMSRISQAVFVDDSLINELVKDLQRSLLQADVNVKAVLAIAQQIKERIKTEKTPTGLTKKDHLVHILYEELSNLLGGEFTPITITRPNKHTPFTFMLVGLFGAGKTTTAGKLAKYYAKRGFKVALVSTDTWRPAAFEQLKQTGEKIHVPVFGDPTQKDPVKLYQSLQKQLVEFDIVIVDTAGRDALNDELIQEIDGLTKVVNPQEVLLTMSADIGQTAKDQAQAFKDTCGVSGLIITKLDGTAKGGGALTAAAITQAPVKFIGIGEKVDDFEEFKAKNFVGQLLGMGDFEKLLTKVEDAFEGEDVQDLSKRLLKGEFTLIDLYDQMKAVKKMGPLTKVLDLIPGMGSAQLPKEAIQVQEEKIVLWKYIMDSCTKKELEDPSIMSTSRIQRIAKGSGTNERDVRDLLKHYKQSKKMVRALKGMGSLDSEKPVNEKQMQKMMRKMGNTKNVMKQFMKGGR